MELDRVLFGHAPLYDVSRERQRRRMPDGGCVEAVRKGRGDDRNRAEYGFEQRRHVLVVTCEYIGKGAFLRVHAAGFS